MRTLKLAAGLVLALPVMAFAQAWPAKPVKTVQTLGTGGGAEPLAHMVAIKLSEALGQPVVVEPQAGAGGAVGMHMVARSPADGYTIGLGAVSALVMRKFLVKNTPYDTLKDFTPIILVGETVTCIVASPATGFNGLQDMIAYARKNPGKLSYGSSGIGTTHHLNGVLMEQVTGTEMLHVPYKGGGQSVQGLLSGQVQVVYGIVGTMVPLIKSGKVKMLGINSTRRFVRMPDVPTTQEQVPGFDRPPSWNGYLGPAGMPPSVTRRLYEEINRVVTSREVNEKLTDLGFLIDTANPEEFSAHIRKSFDQFGRVIKAAKIEPE
jgi:tripartite-type tricarboxylate transporter receptor subunit TctC